MVTGTSLREATRDKTGGLLTSGSKQPPTWPDGSLPRGPGSSVSHSRQESRACPTLCRVQVPGAQQRQTITIYQDELVEFLWCTAALVGGDVCVTKWARQVVLVAGTQYSALRALLLLGSGTGRSRLELQVSQQGQLNGTQAGRD